MECRQCVSGRLGPGRGGLTGRACGCHCGTLPSLRLVTSVQLQADRPAPPPVPALAVSTVTKLKLACDYPAGVELLKVA